MFKKKFHLLIVAFFLVTLLAACGSAATNTPVAPTAAPTTAAPTTAPTTVAATTAPATTAAATTAPATTAPATTAPAVSGTTVAPTPAPTLPPPTPNASGEQMVYALTTAGQLVTFDQKKPGEVKAKMMISGLGSGEKIADMDVRPANKKLYAVSNLSQLYTIDPTSGAATKVGTPFTPALQGKLISIDFNPTVDRLRVITEMGENLRVNPENGAIAATDKPLIFNTTDKNMSAKPKIVAAAYGNNYVGGGTTTLYNIDATLGILTTQAPPNDGIQNTVGTFGMAGVQLVGFDITTTSAGQNALLALQMSNATQSKLYTIDLKTAELKEIGTIAADAPIAAIALAL
jgi:Domain of unknown function (DUF4394)